MAHQQLVGGVLVKRGRGDLGVGDEAGQPAVGPGVGEHLEVEVGERHYRAHVVAGAQLLQRGHVAGIVDPWDRIPVVGRILRGRQRVGIGRHDDRVLGKRRDDVVALAHSGEQHAEGALHWLGFHPPVSPL